MHCDGAVPDRFRIVPYDNSTLRRPSGAGLALASASQRRTVAAWRLPGRDIANIARVLSWRVLICGRLSR